jgi:hypothetical protein
LYERRLGGLPHALPQDNFHWPISGPHFRDYRLLLDEQGEETLRNADLIWLIVFPVGDLASEHHDHTGLHSIDLQQASTRHFASGCAPARDLAFRALCRYRWISITPSNSGNSCTATAAGVVAC